MVTLTSATPAMDVEPMHRNLFLINILSESLSNKGPQHLALSDSLRASPEALFCEAAVCGLHA